MSKMIRHPMQNRFDAKKITIGEWNCYAVEQFYPVLREYNLVIKRKLLPEQTPNNRGGKFKQTLPVTLFPTVISRTAFEIGQKLQPIWNELITSISRDIEFLTSALNENVTRGDAYTRNLLELYKSVHQNGIAEDYSMGIFRCDYIPTHDNLMKAVKLNTLSVNFVGMAAIMSDLHRRFVNKLNLVSSPLELMVYMPENTSRQDVAKGLLKAQKLYGNGPNDSIILIVVDSFCTHVNDIRMIEEEIGRKSNHGVFTHRAVLSNLKSAIRSGPNKELLLMSAISQQGPYEVGVVYFRAGRAPEDFSQPSDWELFRVIQHSRAIKCPNIGMYLASMKHFQKLFSMQPELLECYLTHHEAQLIKESLVTSFDVNERNIHLAENNTEKFILTHNRKGGNCKIYGDEIASKMVDVIKAGRAGAFTLSEYIEQKPTYGYVVQPFLCEFHEWRTSFGRDLNEQMQRPIHLTNELGFFGVHIGSTRSNSRNSVVANYTAGHLLRSKLASSMDINLINGISCLDSPLLL